VSAPAAGVASVDSARVRTFLADSLALWRVAGSVEAGEPPIVAVIRAHDGPIVWVEQPSGQGMPFRWCVRSRGAGEAPGGLREERPRACASVVGLLNAVRGVLGVERGSAVRIAPAPSDE
jgi:hypothetical protein